MKEGEMETVADLVNEVLTEIENKEVASAVRARVAQLCKPFPLYPELQP
jgi:glycine/serine hydroxymethyltransferase